jgi:hypothetical protein
MPPYDPPALPVTTPGERACRLVEWKPGPGNSALAGRASIAFSGGWVISSIAIFRGTDGSLSAGVPSAPIIGPDGAQLLDVDGKRRYAQVISFETKAARERWNRAILGALAAAGIAGAAS